MLAVLLAQITGMSVPVAAIVAAVISAIYVGLSGFRAVVRTDILQLVLMFGGFLVLLPIAVSTIGGFGELWRALPTSHRSWDGGLGWQTVLVWYLIALQTVVEP
jgi:SSS family solute:Na+ symporter